ncbi:hypothetical protein QQS21_005704 [Conoideocrella luteorostrata]|uniref:Apolipoprotein/apolipophorin n=1 Tax=Conoideocrella luteorostrata TaxID=1105319 RepID=A0AAJ0CRQ4_9HYPO|nr:hypothetical protein QQS21_005704 [Conoideocrella luteorostrata]
MISSRQFSSRLVAARPAPRVAARRVPRRQPCRYQSTTPSSSSGGGAGTSSFAIGVAGGAVGAALMYGVYSFTPAGRTASKLNKAAVEATKTYQAAAQKLQESTPDADQAVNSIKQFAYSYAAWVPGGKGYVDAAFKDWETVRENHKEDTDKIVNDAYKQLKEVSRSGLSLETLSRVYEVLADVSKKIANLSGEAISEILDNHPEAKEKFGGSVEKLQSMANNYGPDAKKQVDETWSQVKDVLAGGFSAANLDKARKLIDDKVQQVSDLGDDAWKKGLEAAKPYLDKNPKVKELIEKNTDSLKQGNFIELFNKVRSGDFEDLQKYVRETVDKAKPKSSGGSDSLGLDKYLKMVPQGSDVLQKLQQIGEVADKHKDEGEKLFKETVEEIKRVLEKQSEKGKDIVDKAKKEAK